MPAESWIDRDYHAASNSRSVTGVVAGLARRQHRVAARAQLLANGLSRDAIDYRIRTGWWRAVHPGVYVLGPGALTREGERMAAVLAGGRGAVLSHGSAAALWGLSPRDSPPVDVSTPTQHQLTGVRFHRSSLPADELTVHRGIPVTSVPRTLFDNAAVSSRHRFERLLQEAEYRRLVDRLSLPDLVDRYPGRRGVATVRAVLADGRFGASISKEELELRFVAFVDRHAISPPVLNGMVATGSGAYEADCHWPEARLIAELDGRGAHLTSHAFEADRARDRALSVAGWRVIRITWRQLHADEPSLAADLRTLLRWGSRR